MHATFKALVFLDGFRRLAVSTHGTPEERQQQIPVDKTLSLTTVGTPPEALRPLFSIVEPCAFPPESVDTEYNTAAGATEKRWRDSEHQLEGGSTVMNNATLMLTLLGRTYVLHKKERMLELVFPLLLMLSRVNVCC